MSIKYYITAGICIFIVQSLCLKQSDRKKSDRINYLLQGKIKDLKTHQIVLMTEEETTNLHPKIGNIIQQIKQSSPTITVNFKLKTNWVTNNLIQLPSLINPRTTTVFILITDSTTDTDSFGLSDRIKFLNQLSTVHIRPKCLIIHLPEKNFAYRNLFRGMWNKQFLDVSVLQIIERNVSLNAYLSNRFQRSAFLYTYNPFSQSYQKEIFRYGLELFPNKLKDLQGFKVKVGLVHDPPFAFVQRNLTKHPVQISGPNANTLKALSEKLNFTFVLVESNVEQIGSTGCNKANFTGLLRQLLYHDVQFIANYQFYFHDCSKKWESKSRFLGEEVFVAVVPKFNEISLAHLSIKTLYTVLGASMGIFLLWALVLLMKFDQDIWNPLYIFQSALGFTVSKEPQNLAERVIFCCIVITNVVYLGYLYTIFTDLILVTKSKFGINNVEDLQKLGLPPMIYHILHKGIENFTVGYLGSTRNISLSYPGNGFVSDCFHYLDKYQNVTCIVRGSEASWLVENFTKLQVNPRMKILNEPVWYTWRYFTFERGLPYIKRFNKVFLELAENGLLKKWENNRIPQKKKLSNKENIVSTRLTTKVFFIPAAGYLISLVVFIGEVVFNLLRRE